MLMPHENGSAPLGPLRDRELATLFQEHNSLVLGAAYRVTGSSQDAEDVLQTVFLRLARRRGEVELGRTVASYLYRAAVNASIDLLRARSRAGAIPLDETDGELPERDGPSPEHLHRDREFRRELREALQTLPERSAQIFVLRYFEELSNKEIAQMLNLTNTTVAVILYRVRRRLQSTLQKFARGDRS